MTDLNEDLKIIGDVKVTPRRAARTAIPNRIFDARPVSLDSPFAVACVADRNARKRRKMEVNTS